MTDIKNNKPPQTKKFDTTTHLVLKDTFDADEITLVDEIHDPDLVQSRGGSDENEDSVTMKISVEQKNPEISVVSNVSKQLNKITRNAFEQSGQLRVLEGFKNLFFVVYQNSVRSLRTLSSLNLVQKNNFKIKKPVLIFGAGLVFAFLILSGAVCIKKSLRSSSQLEKSVAATSQKNLPQTGFKSIKLTPLQIYDATNTLIDGKKIKAGSHVSFKFSVVDWQGDGQNKVALIADVRVYAGNGHLELFQPKAFSFDGAIDKDKDQLAVNTWFDFSKDLNPGFYRVVISVQEQNTGRRSEIQSNIRIVP